MKRKKHSRAIQSMENTNPTVYIVDIYNRFCSDKVISTFKVNNREYCIKEVTLEWGAPKLSGIEEDAEQPYFKLYDTLEEVQEYIKQLKQLEGARL